MGLRHAVDAHTMHGLWLDGHLLTYYKRPNMQQIESWVIKYHMDWAGIDQATNLGDDNRRNFRQFYVQFVVQLAAGPLDSGHVWSIVSIPADGGAYLNLKQNSAARTRQHLTVEL